MLKQSPEDYFRKSITVPFLYCTLNEMKTRFTNLHARTALGLQLVPSIIENIAPQLSPPPPVYSFWIRPLVFYHKSFILRLLAYVSDMAECC